MNENNFPLSANQVPRQYRKAVIDLWRKTSLINRDSQLPQGFKNAMLEEQIIARNL